MKSTVTKSISLWYENGGLGKMKIEAVFNIFKLVSIFGVSSIPFWLSFNGSEHSDISDVSFKLTYWWLWGYYLLTYGAMSYFIVKPSFRNIDVVVENKDFFIQNNFNIDSTEDIMIADIVDVLPVDKHDFLLEAISTDNFLMSLEDKGYLDIRLPFCFKNILSTRPFELALVLLLKHFYLEDIQWLAKSANDNSDSFSKLSKKLGIIIIPFIPALVLFSLINHIITYINNRDFLKTYNYNRLGVWKFRYYNEFLCLAKKRLDTTREAAQCVVIDMFLENWKSSISKGLSFLCSLLSLFLVVFSFNGYERAWGMDIIPLIALTAGVSTMLFPYKRNVVGKIDVLKTVIGPDTVISEYFESKIGILLKEVLSILALPIVLIWIIPDKSFFIAHFMQSFNEDGKCTFASAKNQHLTTKTKRSYEYMSLQDDSLVVV